MKKSSRSRRYSWFFDCIMSTCYIPVFDIEILELQITDWDSSPARMRSSFRRRGTCMLAAFSESELNDRQIRSLITGSTRHDSRATASSRWCTCLFSGIQKGGPAPIRVVIMLLVSLEADVFPRPCQHAAPSEHRFPDGLVFRAVPPDTMTLISTVQKKWRLEQNRNS